MSAPYMRHDEMNTVLAVLEAMGEISESNSNVSARVELFDCNGETLGFVVKSYDDDYVFTTNPNGELG